MVLLVVACILATAAGALVIAHTKAGNATRQSTCSQAPTGSSQFSSLVIAVSVAMPAACSAAAMIWHAPYQLHSQAFATPAFAMLALTVLLSAALIRLCSPTAPQHFPRTLAIAAAAIPVAAIPVALANSLHNLDAQMLGVVIVILAWFLHPQQPATGKAKPAKHKPAEVSFPHSASLLACSAALLAGPSQTVHLILIIAWGTCCSIAIIRQARLGTPASQAFAASLPLALIAVSMPLILALSAIALTSAATRDAIATLRATGATISLMTIIDAASSIQAAQPRLTGTAALLTPAAVSLIHTLAWVATCITFRSRPTTAQSATTATPIALWIITAASILAAAIIVI